MGFVGKRLSKLRLRLKLLFQKNIDVRYTPGDVKLGDTIRIQLKQAQGGFALVDCIGNDPINRLMLIRISWSTDDPEVLKKEFKLLNYSGNELINFHVLNCEFYGDPFDTDDSEESVIETLDQIRVSCEKNEEYEKAINYREAINILKSNKQINK